MSSTLEPRNIVVNGHRTSVRLEPEMWAGLEDILGRERLLVNRLCTLIDRQRSQSSLTAAIRVYVLSYFRTAATLAEETAGQDEPTRLLAEEWEPHLEQHSISRRGDDFEEKKLWSQEALHANRNQGFLRLYDVWNRQRALRGKIPRMEELTSGGMEREWNTGNVNVIDIADENPANFRLARTTPLAAIFFRSDVTNFPIGRLPFRLHAESMATEFNRLKGAPRPALYSIDQCYSGTRRSYMRLALPVADASGRVTRLVNVIRGKDTEPSIYEERIFGRRLPTLQQISDDHPARFS